MTAILLQEHKLQGRDQCRNAEEWCARRDWNSMFKSAVTLPSGQPSGGVAILCAQMADLGVTDPMLPSEGCGHRLLGLRLAAPGLEQTIIVSAYLQAGRGFKRHQPHAIIYDSAMAREGAGSDSGGR